MSEIEFTSELSAVLVDSLGSDLTVINAARISLKQHSEVFSNADDGLLRFLMKNRHASPFEHCIATFLVECPLYVRSEWHRHRTQSYNEMSGRYTELMPKFYVPNEARPLIQQGKPGAYNFTPGSEAQFKRMQNATQYICSSAWLEYQDMLADGIAKEVARIVLPVTTFTKFYATANLRNWLGFLSLRTDPTAMEEIRNLAGQVETLLHHKFPATLNAWDQFGRGGI